MQGRPGADDHLLSRRTALRGAAGVAGAAWLVPVVTVVSMDSASAASAAPPSEPGGSLAFTGTDSAGAAALGVGTLAVGAAAVVAAHHLRKPGPGTEHLEGHPRPEGDSPS